MTNDNISEVESRMQITLAYVNNSISKLNKLSLKNVDMYKSYTRPVIDLLLGQLMSSKDYIRKDELEKKASSLKILERELNELMRFIELELKNQGLYEQ